MFQKISYLISTGPWKSDTSSHMKAYFLFEEIIQTIRLCPNKIATSSSSLHCYLRYRLRLYSPSAFETRDLFEDLDTLKFKLEADNEGNIGWNFMKSGEYWLQKLSLILGTIRLPDCRAVVVGLRPSLLLEPRRGQVSVRFGSVWSFMHLEQIISS